MSTVLLVEDDPTLRRVMRAQFRAWDFTVAEAGSGEEALGVVSESPPDLVVLDLGLPGIDGIETIRYLRTFSTVPVLVLTVRDALGDKIAALESGADDYVLKPFEPEELRARARAQLRRSASTTLPPALRIGDLEIDLRHQAVTWQSERVQLTKTEHRLLDALLARRGRLVPHDDLVEAIWGPGSGADQARLRVLVVHLRRKLHDDAARPHLILTEPGLGYRWIGDAELLDEEHDN
ncbi:MAG: response regulator transcription factor [Acidimicrobiia bacterium]